MPIPQKENYSVPKTARERIYQTLKNWIQTNTLKPGERISDTDLASYFSVSRTPVREAMQLLADQKLIEILPGKESRVTPIDFVSIREDYLILARLNALAIRFAFPHITAQHIQELEELNEQIKASSFTAFAELDNEFHTQILDIAGNPFLIDFCDTLCAHVIRFKLFYLESSYDISECYEGHKKILDALKARDLDIAEKLMYDNFAYMTSYLDELIAGRQL